ncbi:MAG: VOC family protein, partial [Acidobacteriota bacterium]|nr:VOC family protein [Acidobacteriota bacterium]
MSKDPDFCLNQIGQIAVNALDIERATTFYCDTLKMRYLFGIPNNASFFDCDGIMLMLMLPSKPEFDHPGSILYFNVKDIQQATETLIERGVQFEENQLLSRTWVRM